MALAAPQIDVWSVGCILAELFSGRVLFPNDSVPIMLTRMLGLFGAHCRLVCAIVAALQCYAPARPFPAADAHRWTEYAQVLYAAWAGL